MNDVNIQNMISSIQNNNERATADAFKSAIMSKVTAALDVKRVELASTVYNRAVNDDIK